jgi:hypothetical protein
VLFEQQGAKPLQANHLFEATLQLTIQSGVVEAHRRLIGERRQQLDVARVERVRVARVGREGPERSSARAERQHQEAARLGQLGREPALLGRATERRAHDLWPTTGYGGAGQRAVDRHAHRAQLEGAFPDRDLDFQLTTALAQQLDRHGCRLGQRQRLLSDHAQGALGLQLFDQRGARGLQAGDFRQAIAYLAVQSGVLNRQRRLLGGESIVDVVV